MTSALAVLLILEAGLRIFQPRYGYTPGDKPFWIADPQVGWRHSPNLNVTIRDEEFRTNFITNSEGFRSVSEFLSGQGDEKIFAVLGDSFVEALQVNEKETFVYLLNDFWLVCILGTWGYEGSGRLEQL